MLVVGIACFIRWNGLASESIWVDEAFSIELANQGWQDVIRGTAADQHPPLYYFLLKLSMVQGSSPFQLRLLSTVFSIVEVALVLGWGRRVIGWQAGMVAGVLLALAPLHVRFAQMVRMYSLVALLCTLSWILLYRFMRTKRGALAQAAVNLLALYTHNVAFFSVGAQAAAILLHSFTMKDWLPSRKWFGTQLLVGLLYLPWIPVLYSQVATHAMTWGQPLTLVSLADIFTRFTSGSTITNLGATMMVMWLGGWTLLVLFGIWHARPHRASIYLALWFFMPLLGMFLASQLLEFFVDKLLIWLLPPLFLLIGNGVAQLPRRWTKVAVAGVLAGFLAPALFVQQVNLDDQDCRGVAQLLAQQVSSWDAVLFNAGVTAICIRVYDDMSYRFVTYPEDYSILESGYEGSKITAERADSMIDELERGYQGLWLVEFWPHWWDPQGYIEERIDRSAVVEREWQFRGLRVRDYRFTTTR